MLITRLTLLTSNLFAQKEFYTSLLALPATLEGDSLYIQAGNILEFIARHDQKNATDESFNSNYILQVSKIGKILPC